MKILHTSDLHIGKRIHDFSMLEDQEHILNQILDITREEHPDAIILAGDIYDKTVPSAEAVKLFDDFLSRLSRLGKAIFIISGNHDSAERIAFGRRIMEASKVYVAPVYNGHVEPVVLHEGDNEVAFYLLPFIKPLVVQHFTEEDLELKTYNEAMQHVIGSLDLDRSRKNVLITHQHITGAERSESEETLVGGLENIDASVFEAFDYVALGHLHRPQYCSRETICYSGSPLKYSFSEVNDHKSVSIVDITPEGVAVSQRNLTPLRDWHDLRGTFDQLTDKAFYEECPYRNDYMRITLTDEEDVPDAMRRLQAIYHMLMELQYDNMRTRAGNVDIERPVNVQEMSPEELFSELFEKQNAQPLSDEQASYLNSIINEVFNSNPD